MRTAIMTAAFTAAAVMAALSVRAEVTTPTVAHDPLMNRIMSKQLTEAAGGVTAVVLLGSGQPINLSIADPLAPLKPAEGLAAKPAVKPAAHRKVRRDRELLKKLSDDERRADWSGRK